MVCMRTTHGFENTECSFPVRAGFHDWRLYWTLDSYSQWDVEIRTNGELTADATCWVELYSASAVPSSIPECTDLRNPDGRPYPGSGMNDGAFVGWHLWFSLPADAVMTVVQRSPDPGRPSKGSWSVLDQNVTNTPY